MHQHSRALNLMPLFLLALTALLTSNVLVSVTIGMGDVIQSSKAFARDVFCGSISLFIVFCSSMFDNSKINQKNDMGKLEEINVER